MLWSEKARGPKVAGNPLPPKIAALLRESWWLALVAIALYLAADPRHLPPGRSRLVPQRQRLVDPQRRRHRRRLYRRSPALSLRHFRVLVDRAVRRARSLGLPAHRGRARERSTLVCGGRSPVSRCCCSRAAASKRVRLHTLQAALPLAPGGVIGAVLGGGLAQALGFTGGTLILLLVFAAGLSLFTGHLLARRVRARSATGASAACASCCGKWTERQDRRAGEQAVIERDEVVEESEEEARDPRADAHRAAAWSRSRSRERVGAREAGAAVRESARLAAAAARSCWTKPRTTHRNAVGGDAGIHLAPDREEAARFRRRR